MWKRIVIITLLLAIVGGGGTYAYTQRQASAESTPAPTATVAAPIEDSSEVIAEGRIVPARQTALSFSMNGVLDELGVREGDTVSKGQVIARLRSARLVSAIEEAQANLAVAEARLIQAQQGPDAEDIATYRVAIEVAESDVKTAQAAVTSAEAQLARAKVGPTKEDVAIAQRRVEVSKNALWAAQAGRDAICGRVGKGAQEADCDQAQAAVNRSEQEVAIAKLQAQQSQRGPKAQDIAAANAQVDQSIASLATAEARVRRARADLARAKKGPSAADVAVAKAQADQARVAVESARAALADMALVSPTDGVVFSCDAAVGETYGPNTPLVRLASIGDWRVETTDLSELDVVRVHVGDQVTVGIDALPDLVLKGHVERIVDQGHQDRGEIMYTVVIALDVYDERLRWGMTTVVTVESDA